PSAESERAPPNGRLDRRAPHRRGRRLRGAARPRPRAGTSGRLGWLRQPRGGSTRLRRRPRPGDTRADRAPPGVSTAPASPAATDVGGTFTDLVYFFTDPARGAQEIVTAKADTTPPDFERGVLDVLTKSGVSLADVEHLAHGTTLVINALTERQGVITGLI